MTKPARKWLIGLLGFATCFVVGQLTYAPTLSDAVAPCLVIGVLAALLSMLRPPVALGLAGVPAAFLVLMGHSALNQSGDGAAMAGGFFWALGLALGMALATAVLGGWAFDQFLQAAPVDPD